MKKNTIVALYNYFVNNDDTVDLSTVVDDIRTEYERNVAQSVANRDVYEQAKPIVLGVMGDTPLMVKEIFEKCKDNLPEGFTTHKIQYAFRNYWNDEIVKHDNGKSPFTYTVK